MATASLPVRKQHFGLNTEIRRKELSMSVEQLSDDTGIAVEILRGFENGSVNLYHDDIQRIADALRCTNAKLYEL
jgi:transcriptional regulator with XRE-family HTH domain